MMKTPLPAERSARFPALIVKSLKRILPTVGPSKKAPIVPRTAIATTTSDARGNYGFKGLDLGSYKVTVTPPGGGAGLTSRTVAITRGVEIRDNDLAVAPRQQTPPAAPKPTTPPANRPAPRPLQAGMPSMSQQEAMFAAISGAAGSVAGMSDPARNTQVSGRR